MSKLLKVLALTLCLLTIVASGALAGCQSKLTLPKTLDEFTLTDLWEKALAATEVQETSAQLGSLWLRIEADGSVRLQNFVFSGRNQEGYPMSYWIWTNTEGKIDWYSSEMESVPMTGHPRSVFAEIDKLGLEAIPQGDDGCELRVEFEGGSHGSYYSEYAGTICQLNDGQLQPLKEVSFASGLPFALIVVSPMCIVEEGVDEEGHSFKHSATNVNEQCMEQIWFLAADIAKAESVEYSES
jgi:hypothetical protein